MADLIAIQPSTSPWLPTADSEPVVTYHYHDIPLIGIVRQHGVLFLFQCLLGEMDAASIWAYTLIQPGEQARLDRTDGPEEFDAVLDHVTAHRPAKLAFVVEGEGVLSHTMVEDLSDDRIGSALSSLLVSLRERTERVNRALHEGDVSRQLVG
jgi:hypothetical protein